MEQGLWIVVFILVVVLAVTFLCQKVRTGNTATSVVAKNEEKIGGKAGRFPYLYLDLPLADSMFQTLKAIAPEVLRLKGFSGGVVARSWPRDTYAADALSSYFTEKERMRCAKRQPGGNSSSPIDMWEKNEPRVRQSSQPFIAKGLREGEALREGLYVHTKYCNYYNPAFCLWLFRQLARELQTAPGEIRILDPSSGWGDRLLAACAFGCGVYHGYDPNSALQPAYSDIIKKYSPKNTGEGNFWVKAQPFEKAQVSSSSYDIVHTSPPFFDLELYTDEGGAAARQNAKYGQWLKRFYRPYLTKAWHAVKPGGFLVLYVDVYRTLVADTHKILQNLGAKISETVYGFRQDVDWPEAGIKNEGPVRPAYVWRRPPAQ